MAEWNRLLLGKLAKELGFVRDTYEKVCRLTEVLKFFETDDLLGSSLALKGGTAINLIIFDLPRLSVDIDLDFSENISLDDMMTSRSKINDRIEKFMTANGYSLSSENTRGRSYLFCPSRKDLSSPGHIAANHAPELRQESA